MPTPPPPVSVPITGDDLIRVVCERGSQDAVDIATSKGKYTKSTLYISRLTEANCNILFNNGAGFLEILESIPQTIKLVQNDKSGSERKRIELERGSPLVEIKE